jgi:cytochrome P450
MIGLINGFVPTNAKAGAQILAVLLSRPEVLRAAERAAQDGDDDLLRRCLFEALRFKHALPVIFRRCAVSEYPLGRWRKVRKDMYVGAAVQLAAFDRRRVLKPSLFDPARDAADSLALGYGQHRCIGFAFAAAQITATFRPLLLQGNLHSIDGACGRPVHFASFVERHRVAFGAGPVQ